MAEKTELQNEVDKLRNDFTQLRGDVKELVATLKEIGAEKAKGMKSSLDDELKEKREDVLRAWATANEKSRKAVSEMEDGIGNHPFSSVLTAFAVGFAVAKLFDQGRRN